MQPATLTFFRTLPADPLDATLPSLQGFETSLFLIALSRFPHALTSCATAIEAVIKASSRCATNDDRFVALLSAARKAATTIAAFPQQDVDEFRKKRNDIVHKGFSPKDDNVSVELLLKTGIPLLAQCFSEFHNYDFFHGLLPEYTEHLRVAQKVYLRQQQMAPHADAEERDVTYCFRSLAHLIRWSCKHAFSSSWEIQTLSDAEDIGVKFEHTEDERRKLEGRFGSAWRFDCPVCGDYEAAVAELDEDALTQSVVRPSRLACTNCGLVVRKEHRFLAEELLSAATEQDEARILKEYGITKRPDAQGSRST